LAVKKKDNAADVKVRAKKKDDDEDIKTLARKRDDDDDVKVKPKKKDDEPDEDNERAGKKKGKGFFLFRPFRIFRGSSAQN
jgi:hypothetical protein